MRVESLSKNRNCNGSQGKTKDIEETVCLFPQLKIKCADSRWGKIPLSEARLSYLQTSEVGYFYSKAGTFLEP